MGTGLEKKGQREGQDRELDEDSGRSMGKTYRRGKGHKVCRTFYLLIYKLAARSILICINVIISFDRFEKAISSQPIAVALCTDRMRICGTLLIVFGTVLVLSSTWSLGILGTFLGVIIKTLFCPYFLFLQILFQLPAIHFINLFV